MQLIKNQLLEGVLINSSFRCRPESTLLESLDPGLHRNDGKVINQRFLEGIGGCQ